MANTSSAKKQARESARRALRNRSVRSAVKTRIARARRAASDGTDDVQELALSAISSLDRAAAKGILHRNNVARRKARLMKRLGVAEKEPVQQKGAASRGRRASAAPTAEQGVRGRKKT